MSPEEFDNYLTLLASLLRTSGKQREGIARELRTHLDDRLEDLLARGVPRDEAIRRALAEFGDAAGLAADFVSLSRNRKRRWLMRVTTASVAATILFALGFITFWPGTNAGPGAAQLAAQAPEGGEGTPGRGGRANDRGPADIAAALNKRLDVAYVDIPLKDVIEHLKAETGLAIYVKERRLAEEGVAIDSPVTLQFENIRLRTFLDLMLEGMDLVYVEKDDLLVITTKEDAEATMEVRVYDCRDLLTMPTASESVRQRGAAGMGMPGMAPGAGLPGTGGPPAHRPPAVDDPFGDGPSLSVPPARPAGPDPFAPPSPVGPPGGQLLPPASVPGDSSFDPRPATIPRQPPSNDVLPQMGGFGSSPAAGDMMMGGIPNQLVRQRSPEDQKAEELIEIITTAVDHETWADNGGPGTIGQYNGLIVVSQSARTHSKIEKVLDMLREAAGLPKPTKPLVVR